MDLLAEAIMGDLCVCAVYWLFLALSILVATGKLLAFEKHLSLETTNGIFIKNGPDLILRL